MIFLRVSQIYSWQKPDHQIFFLYLYYECISDAEWFWNGFGSVLDWSLFWYISHLTINYSQYKCHISIKVYGIYFGNIWMNYRFQNQSKTEPKPIEKQSKKNSKMDFKIYSCELEQESSINLNTKIMNFISSDSLID